MATNTLKPFSGELDPPSNGSGLKEFTGTLDGEPSTDGPLSRGWNKSKQNIGITASLAAGNAERAAAQVAQVDTYARANLGMAEGRELGEAWERGEGITGGIKEVAGEFAKDWREAPGVIGGLRATGKNLQAMGAGLLEQVPNMVAPVAGMAAGAAGGAAAGSAIPGVGNVAGGLAGGWAGASLGNTAIEGGGMVQAALQKAGIDPQNTAAVQQYLRENGDTLLGQAGVKGSIIGAVDTLTAGVGGRILNAPARAAVDRALTTMGVDLADKAAVGAAMKTPEFAGYISRDAAYKAAKTGGANLARNAGVAALDPAGEFAGEFVGQGVATGEWDTKDAALEAFSSLGQSGAMFAGQKAYQAATRPLRGKGAAADQPTSAEWTTAPGAADPNAAGAELPATSAATSFEADFGTEPGAAPQREGGVDFTRDVDTSSLSLEDPAELKRARAARIDFEAADTTPAWQTEHGATAERMPGLDMPAAEFDTSGLALEGARKPSELLGLDPSAGPLSRTAARAVDARAAQEAQFIGSTGRELAARNLPSTFDPDNVIDVQGRVVDDKAIDMTRRLAGPKDGEGRGSNADVTGQRIDQEWTAFSPASGPLGVPRAAMPQISSEHRGALLEYLGANGVGAQAGVVPSSSLKPTQAEFSEEKVKRAQQFPSGDRAILISADGYVVDGHHQWLAMRGGNAPVQVLQLQAPIQNLLPLVSQFPRARAASGAAALTQETENYVPQADQAQPDGTQSQAPTGAAVAPGAAAAGQAAAAPVTAGGARRARSGGDAARSRAWDANPMRAFLGKHGVSLDSRSEFAPGLKEQRGALVPGYGPVFRKTGKPLDRLVDNAVEEGFLPQGATEADLYGLIDRALRQGERVAPMYTADAAESQMQAMLDRQRQFEQEQQEAWDQEAADYEAVLAQELATMDDAEYAALDAVIPALNAGSNTSTEAAMRALGFTEQEIQDVVAQQSREPQEGGQRPGQAGGTVSGSAQARDGTGQRNARDQEQELSSYTREDVLGRQGAQERTQAQQAQANREADRRAQADRELPEFTLTGSDRPADANPNQGDIFNQPAQEAEPAANSAATPSKQKRKSYSGKVGDDSRTSTLKGSLVAREQQKRESFERLKKVRQAVKDGRANRLDLLKAEDAHRTLVREVASLKAEIPQFSRANGPAQTLLELREQFAAQGIAVDIGERQEVITLYRIVVPEGARNAGSGTTAMRELVEYADRTGQHIALTPSEDFGGSKKRLVDFYKRFGFIENKGRNRAFQTSESMYRQAPGKVLYSRAERPAVTNAQAQQLRRAMTQRTVDGLARGWSQRPDIVVVDSMQDVAVPEAVRRADEAQRSQGAAGNVEGFWHGGKVYLVADALPSSQDVARVLYHEVLGHHGLRGHFGPALDKVRDQVAKMRPKDIQAKAEEYGLDLSQPAHVRYAAEEVLAEMAQTRPDLALVQRAIAAIRTFLREHVPGFKSLELTDAEIVRNYLMPARGFIERGNLAQPSQTGIEQGAPAFSLQPDALAQANTRWNALVDKFVRGGLDETKTYEVLPSSTAVMKLVGLPDLPIHAGVHALDALYNHGVKPSQMKQVLDELANPRVVMIWDKGRGGEMSLNFVTSMSNGQGLPFVIGLKPNRGSRQGRHHWLATVTEKQPSSILGMIRDGGAVFVGEGNIAGIDAAALREALRFAKEKRGKESRDLKAVMASRDGIPNLVQGTLYSKDLEVFKSKGAVDAGAAATPTTELGKSVLQEGAQSNRSVAETPSAISGRSTGPSLAQGSGERAPRDSTNGDTEAPKFSRSQLKAAITTSMGTLTPEQERAYLAVAGFDKVPTLRERTKTFTANLGLRMKQAMVDQFAPIAELDQGAYMLARMSKGSDGTLEAALLYGKPVLRDGVPDVDAKEGGFAQVLASLKGEQDRFLMWVAAQRAESLKAQGKENLFDDRDISSLKTLDAGSMADGTGRARVYAKALRDLNAFNDSVLKMAQESGLIDQAAYDLMQGQPYVPFYRLMEEEGGLQGPSFSKGLTNQKAWKKLKGGSQQLNGDLLQNLLLNWGNLYAASARNRAALATMDAAEKMAVAYKVPADTKGAAKVMRDGVTEHWAVEDPYLLEAISALNYSASPLMKPLAKAKQVLTWGVTVNPTFKLRNLVRDAVSSISMADLSYNPAANVSNGWKLTAKDSQVYASMLASGGVIKFGTQENTERLRAQVAKLGGVVLDQNGAQKLWSQVKAVYDVYQEFGDRTENVNRTALYDRLIAKGHSHAEASFMARDLMDFSMSGSHPVVRFLTQSVPFLNARLQGLYKLGRAAKADPRRFATVAGAVTLASLGLMAAYADDEDWKKREDWDRDSYWWFKIGETAYRIPKPFEVGAIGTLAERTAELMLSEEMTSKRFADRISHMVAQTFAFDPVPQAFKPLLDIYSNKDSFTGRAIESQADQRLRPEDRYNERTSEAARLLGSWGLPDPAQLLKGEWVGLSPKQVDHLLRGYFSWAASAVTTATDYAIRPALDRGDRPAMRLKDVFLAGNFVESLPSGSSRYVSAMYEQARDVEQAYASYRDALARGDKTAAADIMESDGDKLRSRMAMNTATKLLSQLNQQAKKIEGSTTMDSTEKRERLQRIEQRRHEIARRVLGVGAT